MQVTADKPKYDPVMVRLGLTADQMRVVMLRNGVKYPDPPPPAKPRVDHTTYMREYARQKHGYYDRHPEALKIN